MPAAYHIFFLRYHRMIEDKEHQILVAYDLPAGYLSSMQEENGKVVCRGFNLTFKEQ